MATVARGRFVVFEGIDGSGKSTTLGSVAHALRSTWPHLVTTAEQTDGEAGRAARDVVARRGDPLAATYLFMADRAEHVPWIQGHLAAGRHVLCDRFSLSTRAYQSVTLQGRVPAVDAFLSALHAPLGLEPDHTLLFRADPAKCVERVARRGGASPYEKVEFLERVQAAYLRLTVDDPRVGVVDAERPLTELVGEAQRIVRGWLTAP
ncbi:MAG: dTMP kinase [Thermoplasmatota archaeon]